MKEIGAETATMTVKFDDGSESAFRLDGVPVTKEALRGVVEAALSLRDDLDEVRVDTDTGRRVLTVKCMLEEEA